eukprot:1087952-Amphidinium_carterae.1
MPYTVLEAGVLKLHLTRAEQKALDREIPWSAIPTEKRDTYQEAWYKEWAEWEKAGAASPCTPEESKKVLEEMPERVMPSRVLYRNKNARQPSLPDFPKARLVLLGYKDPDIDDPALRRDSPTLSRIGFMVLCHIQMALYMISCSGDATAAFLQGSQEAFEQERPRPLYMRQPREGIKGMSAGSILRLTRGAYGLNTSPRLWFLRFKEVILTMSFKQSKLDPAVFYWHSNDTRGEFNPENIQAVIGIHVDDILLLSRPEVQTELCQQLEASLKFTKWKEMSFPYCGKELQFTGEDVFISQKVFCDDCSIPTVSKERRQNADDPLNEREKTELRSVRGSLQWLVGQTRCDVAAAVSLLTNSNTPTVADLLKANKLLSSVKKTNSW